MLYYKATAGCVVAKKKNDHAPLTSPYTVERKGGDLTRNTNKSTGTGLPPLCLAL